MEEMVPILFLAVILKIPVLYGMWLSGAPSRRSRRPRTPPGDADDTASAAGAAARRPADRAGGPTAAPRQAQPDCPPGGRARTPVIEPRLAPGMAAHERREHTPAGS